MTYNIRMDTVNDGKNQWHLRKDRVIGLIRHYKPDLLGVQEALPQQMAIMVLMVLVVMMEETVASFLLYFIVTIVLNSQIKVHSGYQKLQTHLVV
jgi:endonuclease/exonuclease/phosphatase family metal-dependent hydrolase